MSVSSETDSQEVPPQWDNETDVDINNSLALKFSIKGSIARFNGGTACNDSMGVTFAVPVSWHKLTYSINNKEILHNLTGTALPSRCLAVMGSSGAGKTTFLNAICDRLSTSKGRKLQGTRQLGDVEYKRRYRKIMGFVAQDDILSPWSTPDNSLRFSLRVRRGTDADRTRELVQKTLEELRLVDCRRTVIGIPGLVAGLSGGERKRNSIGVELICDPKILLLDEPTSGLDSVTSVKIVQLLNALSRTGRTVIYTIHQPTAETLTHFDDLMLLTRGRCVYHGTMAMSVKYFESIGYPCPERFTPTDFFMTLLQDPDTSKILVKKWKKRLKCGKRTLHTTAVELNPSVEESSTAKLIEKYIEHRGSSSWIKFTELVSRCATEIIRKRVFITSSLGQAVFFGLLVGLIFINLKNDISGIQDREGLLFMLTMNRAMGQAFMMIASFPQDKPLYIREQQVGSYSPFMYFFSRTWVEFPLRVLFALIESCILYWTAGLYQDAGAFFYYVAVLVLLSEVASGLGFAISATIHNMALASGLTPLLLLPLTIAGGLWANTERLRPYWYWLEKLSFIRHTFILLLRNEMKHITNIKCDATGKRPDFCLNQPKNGEDVLRLLGFEEPQSADWVMWLSLICLYVLFRILLVISLTVTARSKV